MAPCCLEKCTRCLQSFPQHIQLAMQQVRRDLLMLVAPLRCKTLGKQMMLHFSSKNDRSRCFTVLNTTHLKVKPFATGEFALCQAEGEVPPFSVCRKRITLHGRETIQMMTETSVSLEAAQLCDGDLQNLCWYRWTYKPCIHPTDVKYQVTEIAEVQFGEEHMDEEELAFADVASAMFRSQSSSGLQGDEYYSDC
eukprot:12424205-Karenia_brevis.AAC.1